MSETSFTGQFNWAFGGRRRRDVEPGTVRAFVQEFTPYDDETWVCHWLSGTAVAKGDTFGSTSQSAAHEFDPLLLQTDPWIEYKVDGVVVSVAHPFQGYPHRDPHVGDRPLFTRVDNLSPVQTVWVATGEEVQVGNRMAPTFLRFLAAV